MQRHQDVIVGLDIGTTKICAVVGEVSGSDINIIGIGTHPSIGLRKGVVINIESTVESIKKAVEEAELMAGCEISSVCAGIAGGHITGFNSRGIVAIKGSEITENDVERVIDAARAVAIPMDREVIHVLPQEFIVDDESGIPVQDLLELLKGPFLVLETRAEPLAYELLEPLHLHRVHVLGPVHGKGRIRVRHVQPRGRREHHLRPARRPAETRCLDERRLVQ